MIGFGVSTGKGGQLQYRGAAFFFAATLLAVVLASAAWGTVGKFSAVTSSATLTSGAALLASDTSTILPTSLTATLTVNFTETGLGNVGDNDVVTASAHAISTTYFCVNSGGNRPKAANKQTLLNPGASATGTFPVDRNGKVSGTLQLPAVPADPGTFSCPSGQTEYVYMTFTNIALSDNTTGGTGTAPDATTNTVALG